MMIKRDAFLTEAMGKCWHEWVERESGLFEAEDCSKCNAYKDTDTVGEHNFSTWEGFGKLWEWAQKQGWWNYMKFIGNYTEQTTVNEFTHSNCIIHPDRFADAVYKYLKNTKGER